MSSWIFIKKPAHLWQENKIMDGNTYRKEDNI